jgi:hypothetical protein
VLLSCQECSKLLRIYNHRSPLQNKVNKNRAHLCGKSLDGTFAFQEPEPSRGSFLPGVSVSSVLRSECDLLHIKLACAVCIAAQVISLLWDPDWHYYTLTFVLRLSITTSKIFSFLINTSVLCRECARFGSLSIACSYKCLLSFMIGTKNCEALWEVRKTLQVLLFLSLFTDDLYFPLFLFFWFYWDMSNKAGICLVFWYTLWNDYHNQDN